MMPTLKDLRLGTGRSRAKVAADLSISERHLYRYENGQTPLRPVMRTVFAVYYGVKPDEIEEAPL